MKKLSNVELYYSEHVNFTKESVVVQGDEYLHLLNVMRHKIGDEIHITNGKGNIYLVKIEKITKDKIKAGILNCYSYENSFSGITFCIPRLKNNDRFEFALEKCVELGITNVIIFSAERSVAKGFKVPRWNKIILSAMKQSLRSYLPNIYTLDNITELNNMEGNKIILEQNSELGLDKFLSGDLENYIFNNNEKYYFIFGPEGGLTEEEIISIDNSIKLRLTENRLRTETSVISAASLINNYSTCC